MLKLLEKALLITIILSGLNCTALVYAKTPARPLVVGLGSFSSQRHLNMIEESNTACRRRGNGSNRPAFRVQAS